ncbi:MAG: metallophosphoesterase family protein, partial [Anaerohalosphaera sp.]|nr:metallophosphoesterase family protein [Anaerohalosphaera sp.]
MRSARLISIVLLTIIANHAVSAINIVVGPYLQTPTETSITVMWITDVKSTAEVEFGLTDKLAKKAVSTHDGQIDANSTIHRITIKGLKPNTKYNYRVTSTEIIKYEPYKVTFGQKNQSRTFTFTTLDTAKPDCSFVVFNDIHDNVKTLQGLVAMANKKPYEMIFMNGDVINDPGSETQIIEKFLKPSTDLFASRIPFILARGNHEIRGEFSRLLKNYVDTPNDKYYFSFKHGPVYFVVMDCGEDKEDSHWAYSGLNDFEG